VGFSIRLLFALSAFAASAYAPARAAEPTATTLTLLEAGWKASPAAFDAARQQYETLHAAAARDLRLSYAMTLIAIRHHKARDAAEFIDAALVSKPNNLHLRKVKLWLRVLNKDFKSALAEMPVIARDAAATAKDDAAQPKLVDEHAHTLGALLAFMQGPAENPITGEQAAAVEAKLLQFLPPESHDKFNAAKKSVETIHAALVDELRNVRALAKVDGQTKREAELKELQEVRAEYKAEADKIREPYDLQIQQLESTLAELKRTDRPIIKIVRKDNDDKGKEVKTTVNASRIESTNKNISAVRNSLAADLEGVSKQDHRAATRMAQLQKQSKRVSTTGFEENANSVAVRKKMTALSTYCEFPLEEERDKLVQSYQKK
jgi:hypothetical protein